MSGAQRIKHCRLSHPRIDHPATGFHWRSSCPVPSPETDGVPTYKTSNLLEVLLVTIISIYHIFANLYIYIYIILYISYIIYIYVSYIYVSYICGIKRKSQKMIRWDPLRSREPREGALRNASGWGRVMGIYAPNVCFNEV